MTETKKSPGVILLSDVRFSYLYCFEPYKPKPSAQNPNPSASYCVHALMGPKHPDLPKVIALIESVGLAKWGDQWDVKEADGTQGGMKGFLKNKDALCLHRGSVTKPGQPEYKDMFYISASNKRPFTVIDGDRTPLREKDGRPYSGCYGNVIVDIWAQANEWGKRINATVTGVQFLRHGEAFGGGAPPADPNEFGVVATGVDSPAPATTDPTVGLI